VIVAKGINNSTKFQEHIMDVRSRPPRIFGPNDVLIPFDILPAYGMDLFRKYKIKS